jgi:heterodisulfide reductase subunit A-like polyferredoxin
MKLDGRVPAGSIAEKWDRHKFEMKLVNPANKRKYTIIVVGTGLAGASAAASLGELGYNVLNFCIRTAPGGRTVSPLRAASTPPRIIRTTATASIACSTTR